MESKLYTKMYMKHDIITLNLPHFCTHNIVIDRSSVSHKAEQIFADTEFFIIHALTFKVKHLTTDLGSLRYICSIFNVSVILGSGNSIIRLGIL